MIAEVRAEKQRLLLKRQKEQFELSKDNIDLINRKCHDLKHQIAAIRTMNSDKYQDKALKEIEASVMIYDAAAKSGNEVLDTILTERSLLCERNGIIWTCMADGHAIDFVDPIDLYTILGNAFDNACEAVEQLQDPDKRVISLNITNKEKMVIIHIENFYEHEIRTQNGLPVTNKVDRNFHGIGLRSIQYTVEKYNGSVSIITASQSNPAVSTMYSRTREYTSGYVIRTTGFATAGCFMTYVATVNGTRSTYTVKF